MRIPRTNKELGVFLLAFLASSLVLIAALFVVSRLVSVQAVRPTGMAVGGTNGGLFLGLFVVGIIAGLATVVKWRETS